MMKELEHYNSLHYLPLLNFLEDYNSLHYFSLSDFAIITPQVLRNSSIVRWPMVGKEQGIAILTQYFPYEL